MPKPSKFIITVKDGEKISLFNTLTSSVVRLDTELYERLFVCNDFENETETVSILKQMGFLVEDGCNEMQRLSDMRNKFRNSKKDISSVIIAVSTDCNARCYYCYENGIERAPMTMDTAEGVVKFLDKNCTGRRLVVQWFGGEPLCAVDVIDYIASELINRGIELSGLITTNGYAITEEICCKARDLWHVRRFQVPVDSLGDAYNKIKNYKNVKPGEDPFEILISNIHLLLKYGFHVNVRTNFNPKDIEPNRAVLRYLAREFEREERFFAYPAPITGDNMLSVIDLKPEEGMLHPYLDLLLETRELGFFCPTLLKEDDYLEGDETLSGISLISRPTGCYATLPNVFAIDSKGDLYKCHRMIGRGENFSCGNVFTGIAHNSIFNEFCNDVPCYEECNDCSLMPICHGGCKVKYNWHGSKNGCMAIKGIVNDLVRIYIGELEKRERGGHNGDT